MSDEKPRCHAVVWRRDTYRYTGRGSSGFSMHYDKTQCRRSTNGGELCSQHADIEKKGVNVLRCEWAL